MVTSFSHFQEGSSKVSLKLHRLCTYHFTHHSLINMTQLLLAKSSYVWIKLGDKAVDRNSERETFRTNLTKFSPFSSHRLINLSSYYDKCLYTQHTYTSGSIWTYALARSSDTVKQTCPLQYLNTFSSHRILMTLSVMYCLTETQVCRSITAIVPFLYSICTVWLT